MTDRTQAWGALLNEKLRGFEQDHPHLTFSQKVLLRRAAACAVMLDEADARIAANGASAEVFADYQKGCAALLRMMQSLGLDRPSAVVVEGSGAADGDLVETARW